MENKKQIYVSESPGQTKMMGKLLAQKFLKARPGKSARILTLSGGLGAGKTNFVQGLAKGLGVRETINSPTFAIMKKYPLAGALGYENFYHIDCYRLDLPADLEFLGIEKIFTDSRNIVAVEWPDIMAKFLPEDAIKIGFEITGKNSRRVLFGSDL